MVKRTEDVKRKDKLTIFVTDGRIEAEVTDTRKEEFDGREEE